MDLTRIPTKTFDQYSSNEPGFADSMLQAYISAVAAPPCRKLSHDFLQNINRIAMSHKGGTGQYKTATNTYKVYFPHYNGRYVFNYSATHKGVMEFMTYWKKQTPPINVIQFKSITDPKNYFLLDLRDDQIVCLDKHGNVAPQESFDTLSINPDYECIVHCVCRTSNVQELTQNTLQRIFDEFDEDIRVAVTEDQKIYAIAKQIQHIAQAHPFEDGNIRTAYIALNKLLREHGLRLSILIDPNRLDCCDLKLIVDMIKEGQDIYSKLLRHRGPNMFSAVTSDPYLKTISCPPYEIQSALCDTFLSDVVLKECLPSIETCNATLFNPAANQEIIDKFGEVSFHNPQCRSIIAKHISAENYGIALRNACLYREYAVIHFLLDNIPDLDLNGQSKDGNTALDWLEKHGTDADINAVKSRLIELGALSKNQIAQSKF